MGNRNIYEPHPQYLVDNLIMTGFRHAESCNIEKNGNTKIM